MEPAALRVISDHDIRKLTFPTGIPATVEELNIAVKEEFGLTGDFSIQYLDSEFSDYFSLFSTNQIKHKDTIKVVQLAPIILNVYSPEEKINNTSDDTASTTSQDTVELPSRSTQDRLPWPKDFKIPCFAPETEIVLERANEAYMKDGTLLTMPKVKTDILEKLAQFIHTYTVYPTAAQISAVAEALIRRHPCLKEPGSYSGYYGWQTSIKYKMGNFRTKLRAFGVPEVTCNSLKHKHPEDRKSAKNIKKARKAEVNYLPPYPAGENEESMEEERIQLLNETQKKNNNSVRKDKMAKTFAHRRNEVVNLCPSVQDVKERWPALFDTDELNEEFQRITTLHLKPSFMLMLDQYTPKLLFMFHSKGGALGQRLQIQMTKLHQISNNSPIERKREVLCCLVDYLGEKVDDLIKYYQDAERTSILQDLTQHVMKIYVIKEGESPEDVGIVLEGTQVMTNLGSVAKASSILLGLTYALNLSYPKELKYTFEVFQKLFLNLDNSNLSSKVQALKNKLLV